MTSKLTVVVKPFKIEAVVLALLEVGAQAVTLTEARGYGRQKGHLDLYRDDTARVSFLPKVRIECAVEEDAVEDALRRVQEAARTGRIGDGKIFVEELA